MTNFKLTAEELARYTADGYLIRQAAFNHTECRALREAAEAAAEAARRACDTGQTYQLDGKRFVDIGSMTVQFEHSPDSELIRVIEPVAQLEPRLGELMEDMRLTDPIRSILRTDNLSLWTNKLNLKRAAVGSGFGWHQDSPYWIHDCSHVDQLPNVFVAFDDTDATNGCLRIIRGSHTRGCLPGTNNGTQLGGFFTSPEFIDAENEMILAVPAGSLVFFNPHSIHGSMPNTSANPRRAMVITYQPADFPTLKTRRIENIGPTPPYRTR